MKSIIIVVIISLSLYAQTITNYHVGALYSLAFSPESEWDRQEAFTFRAAVELLSPTWKALNITAKGRLIFTTPNEQSVGQLWLIHKNELGEFSLGKQPRPISNQKPNPTTSDAGLEPPARLVIPGATVGFLYSSIFDSNLTIQGGIYDQGDHQIQYNAGMFLKDLGIRVAGYFSRSTHGAAISWENENLSFTGFYSKDMQSCFFEIKWTLFKPYLNWVYDRQNIEAMSSEFGITKEFESSLKILGLDGSLKWLLGLGYDSYKKELAIYSYCHL